MAVLMELKLVVVKVDWMEKKMVGWWVGHSAAAMVAVLVALKVEYLVCMLVQHLVGQ
jgi:hypothetical protein